MTGKERLREDLLTDCAQMLREKTDECTQLKLDNSFMTLQIRMLTCRLQKIGKGYEPR